MHHYQCQNVYISTTASERIVDTLEFFPHSYQMPQLSSTDRLLMSTKDMTDALQNPHPDVPFASVGDDTIAALTDLEGNFQTQITTSSVPRDSSFACQGRPTPKPRSLINPNLEIVHAHQAANEITDDNSHPRHPQCAISSEGGRSKETTSRSERLSPRNLYQHDFCGM
jgi:hypothetical protein